MGGGGGERAGDNNKKIPIYFFNKPILADWPSLPNNLGGGGSYPCPIRLCMQKPNSIIILLFIYLLIKYETAAGCRKPFCVVTQFLTPSAVIISMRSWPCRN